MRKCIPLFIVFFFTVFACHALARPVTLNTIYPAPTSAYNQVNLNPSSAISCNPAYPSVHNKAIFVDSNGALHECNNGISSIYPQECYNIFCSYDSNATTLANSSCNSYTLASTSGTQGVCPTGFNQTAINTVPPLYYDTFQSSAHTFILYAACCSQ